MPRIARTPDECDRPGSVPYRATRQGRGLYVQQPENLLITGDDHVLMYWHAFDTLMDLGLANLAEKNLTECLETFGEHPLILERLARVNLSRAGPMRQGSIAGP